ncbi:MAG: helix-turn-helix domain-containing protein [Arcicella sp.]|jgi:transcriptional regulator with XRE-family HTH domain|nr:helix-turn-helix domain-containing protein [Arcicella sp.]
MTEQARTLVQYLKQVKQAKGFTLNKFADYLEINPSILSRLLSGVSEPSEATLSKIAQKLGHDNTENLQKRVEVQSTVGFGVNQIKLGIPYSIMSLGVLSLIKRERLPNEVAVTFCEPEEEKPFFVKQIDDLTTFENNPESYPIRYHAGNLIKMFENGLIDCMIIPQLLQKNIANNNIIEVAQILEGWNVCLYVIEKKKSKEKNIDGNSLKDLLECLRGQNTQIAYFQNTIVEPQLNTFLNLPDLQKNLIHLSDNLKNISSLDRDFFEQIRQKLVKDKNFSCALVGYEPLTNNIFNQYFGNSDDNLTYKRFNLSKIIDEKITFSLFANKSILDNTSKLKIIQEFLNKLSTERFQTEGIDVSNNQIARLFFSESTTAPLEETKLNRLNRALKELYFFLTYRYSPSFVDVILEKLK